jgi:uncharacterized iron-regulated membrane protein
VSVEEYERVDDPRVDPEPDEPARGRRPWWRRKPIKRGTIWVHRWSAIVIGLALLVVTTSGVPLIYQEEIVQAQHGSAYEESGGPIVLDHAEAYAAVQEHDPEFAPFAVYLLDGVYVADDFETRRVTVDPRTGEILGDFNPVETDGVVPWTMSLMFNLHVCGLSCEGYVGYQAWLAEPVPGTGWAGFDGEPVTWGYLILGITGVLLLFLALSGIWLWWPGIKRWFVGVRVRWKKGRYARDYDLHQVAGMIAIPLLLLWAVTGMGYSFGFVEKAWYSLTPGPAPAEELFLESTESDEPDIGVAAAVAAATETHDDTVVSVDIPPEDDPVATYGVWFSDGIDPYSKVVYPGDYLVSVDRKTGETLTTYGEYGSKSEELWSDWNFPLHSGWALNAWVRIIWVVLGLVPLLLAVTGLSTWFFKRGLRKRRARRLATAA